MSATGVSGTVAAAIPPPPAAAARLALPPGLTPLPAAKDGLSMPGYLTAIAGNRSVLLSWYPSEGPKPVSGYLVYRGERPDSLERLPINRDPVTESNFSDSDDTSLRGPKNRHTYYYRVRAFDTDGRLSPYSDLVQALPNGPLLAPGKVGVEAGDRQVVLRWGEPLSTGDLDLARTWILRGTAEDQLQPLTVVAAGVQTFTDAGLTNASAYYYALRSEDTAGAQSPPSKAQKAVPYRALTPPRNLSALGVGDTVVRLKWDPPADGSTFKVKGYNVYRSTGAAPDFSQ
ncbi:MAG TPA: hypothetical protein VNZ54_05845, partial [bacterium]|nr:hypothetical protein [bacterium]